MCVSCEVFFVLFVLKREKSHREQKRRWEELGEGKNMTKICCMENIIFQLENIKNKEIKCQEQKQLRSKGFICLNEPQPITEGSQGRPSRPGRNLKARTKQQPQKNVLTSLHPMAYSIFVFLQARTAFPGVAQQGPPTSIINPKL